jgi:GTP-binding protein EngB required for normal cell division/uncharacterized protein YukE
LGSIKQEIEAFDCQIQKAHEEIRRTESSINSADTNIKKEIKKFEKEIQELNITAKNEYEERLIHLVNIYKENSKLWCDAIDELLKGKEFIHQFEKSVLVVIFGNVNVGKSTVGNIIAGAADPEQPDYEEKKAVLEKYFGPTPDFYEYDIAGNQTNQVERKKTTSVFKEGYVETTANIQYFTRKEGLTWTDSPGICSVNQENGDLAKKYVEFADMVIFITTSSSPAKADEVQELKKLFVKKKPVLILVNKSDKWVKDEDNGQLVKKLIPKSVEDRKKQEDYIKAFFKDTAGDILKKVDAISISSYLAYEAMKKDDAKIFEQSGFPLFFKILGEILDENAVKLKMNAPKQRINAVIDEIINGGSNGATEVPGICQYKQSLCEMKNTIEEVKDALDKIPQQSLSKIEIDIHSGIETIIHDHAESVRSGKKGNDLGSEVNALVAKETQEVLKKELEPLLKKYDESMINQPRFDGNCSGLNIKETKETIKRIKYEIDTIRREPDGVIEHLEHWILKKEFTRDKVVPREITDTISNGDNSDEIRAEIFKRVDETIPKYVREFINSVKSEYFGQQEEMISKISNMLDQLKNNLEKEKLQ